MHRNLYVFEDFPWMRHNKGSIFVQTSIEPVDAVMSRNRTGYMDDWHEAKVCDWQFMGYFKTILCQNIEVSIQKRYQMDQISFTLLFHFDAS